MVLVNYLAEIWGLSLVLISLALLINQKYLKRLFAEIENEATMFFLGIVSLVIGLAMVLSYNIWDKNWQIIITILGWVSLIKGLSVLFLLEFIKNLVKKMENSQFLPYALFILIFIGLAITYFGFTS
jgi:hypothetical protein